MSVKSAWSDRELYLLKMMWTKCSEIQIKQIFDKLGYHRSLEAIQRQARRYIGKAASATAATRLPPGRLSSEEKGIVADFLTGVQNSSDLKHGNKTTSPPEVLRILNDLRKTTNAPKKHCSSKQPEGEFVVLCLSDIHYGSQVFDDVTGEVIYNTDIAEQYIQSIPDKLAQTLPYKSYAGIVLAMVGDMVDGEEIYPTQGRHLDISVIDQTHGLIKALWKTVKALRQMFPCVRVEAVRGNHGRMSKSADERSNWDNVIYQQLGLMAKMEGDKYIEITHSFGEYLNFTVNGWRGHLRHIGVPHDGTAAMRSKLGSWHQMHNFDFMVCAHLHHAGILNYNGKYIFRNGSIMVANDYAERIARCDPPRQILFCVSKDTLPTFVSFLSWP